MTKPTHRTSLVLGAVGLSLVATQVTNAAVYIGSAHESFNYATGESVGLNGGTGYNATGDAGQANTTAFGNVGTFQTAQGGKLVTTGSLGGGTGNKITMTPTTVSAIVSRGIGQTVDSGTFYFSYLTQRTNDTNRTLNFALFNSTSGAELLSFGQHNSSSSLGNFVLNVGNAATPTPGAPGSPIAYGTNVTHLVVGRIDFNVSGVSDRIRFYVDPLSLTNEASLTPYIDHTTTADLGAITHFRLFAGVTSGVNTSATGDFDEFRFGSNYAAVVPEPSAALLGAVGALALLRRRRA